MIFFQERFERPNLSVSFAWLLMYLIHPRRYTVSKSLVRASCFSLLLFSASFAALQMRGSKRCKSQLDAAESTGVCYLSPPPCLFFLPPSLYFFFTFFRNSLSSFYILSRSNKVFGELSD